MKKLAKKSTYNAKSDGAAGRTKTGGGVRVRDVDFRGLRSARGFAQVYQIHVVQCGTKRNV
jgi:hypothetical protein